MTGWIIEKLTHDAMNFMKISVNRNDCDSPSLCNKLNHIITLIAIFTYVFLNKPTISFNLQSSETNNTVIC